MSKLRRLQELFDIGAPIQVDRGDQVMRLWVAKPNAFERDEAVKDGRLKRGRVVITFDRDEDQQAAVSAILMDSTDEQLVAQLTKEHELEFWSKAHNELRADKAWRERIEALDSAGLGDEVSDDQQAAIRAVNREYDAELVKVQARYVSDFRDDLLGEGRDGLEAKFRTMWRNMLGHTAFAETKRQTELFFALRECVAVEKDGELDHAACDHRQRFLDGREEVLGLPDAVIEKAVAVLDGQMTEAEAGNSDAPSVSSGPSGQRSKQEGSTPSIPTETSPAPAGTSL